MKLFRQPKFFDELLKVVSDAVGVFPSVDPDKVQSKLGDMNSWKEYSRAHQGDKIKLVAKSSNSGEIEYRWKYQILDKKGAKIAEESQTQKEDYIIIPSSKTIKGASIKAECALFDASKNSSLGRAEKTFPIDDPMPCHNFFSTLISVAKDSLLYYKMLWARKLTKSTGKNLHTRIR